MSAGSNSLEDAERKRIELDSKVDAHKTQLSYALGLLALGISAGLGLAVAYYNADNETTANGFFLGSMAALLLALLSLGGVMVARHKLRRDRAALVEAEVAVGILQRSQQNKRRGWFRRE